MAIKVKIKTKILPNIEYLTFWLLLRGTKATINLKIVLPIQNIDGKILASSLVEI